MTIDDILAIAHTRVLTSEEQRRLAHLASLDGKQQHVILSLMRAGTAASRANLLASALAGQHAPKRHSRSAAIQEKRNHRAGSVSDGRVTGLAFTLTHHAVERYAERHTDGQTTESTMEYLTREAVTATPMRARTQSGEQQWVSQSGVVFVLKRDGYGALPVCVTILPRDEDKVPGHHAREGKPRKSRY